MSKRIFSSFIVLIILNILTFQSLVRFSAAKSEDSVTAEPPTEQTELSDGTTSESTLPSEMAVDGTTVQPTTYVKPLKYPSLSVSAISNFFGKANADYNQYTREVAVTYYLKASRGVMTTQWDLSYDPKVLRLDPKKNTAKKICPVIGELGVVELEEGYVKYNATSVQLFNFSADDNVYVKLVFDVADIPDNEPQITKIDLSIDMLWLMDDNEKCFVVNNFNVADLTKLKVSISKKTSITESNYVEPTTDVPSTAPTTKAQGTPDEQNVSEPSHASTVPASHAVATTPIVTKPGNAKPVDEKNDAHQAKPKSSKKTETPVLISPGNPIIAIAVLVLAIGGMVTLLIMRKKVMLNLMLKD